MKLGGIIAGALVGGLQGVGEGMIQSGLLSQKQEAEEKLTTLKEELLTKRETMLRSIDQNFQAGQKQLDRESGERMNTNTNMTSRLNNEDTNATSAANAKMQAATSRGNTEAEIKARHEDTKTRVTSEEKRDTFIDKDGYIRSKATGEQVVDPATNEPIKADQTKETPERRLQREQLNTLLKEINDAFDPKQKTTLVTQYNNLADTLKMPHYGASGGSTSSTIPAQAASPGGIEKYFKP
jgi:hypothetical protein